MVNMAIQIDKETLANLAAFAVIVGYVAFLIIRPEYPLPEELKSIANIGIGFLFTGAGVGMGVKMMKVQADAIEAAKKKEG